MLLSFAGIAQGKEMTLSNASGKQVVTYDSVESYNNIVFIMASKWSDSDAVSKVHSNNSKIVSARAERDESGPFLRVTIKKPGKAKVAYVWKGKKHVITYVVKKYQNPVKSFKFGGKEYASKFKKCYEYNDGKRAKKGSSSGTISVKAAKNWKLKGIFLISDSDAPTMKIKNGKKVELGSDYLTAVFVNKNTKQKEEISLTVRDYDD